jgi:peptidoglycan-N-acetylglucosamine deacetylase
MRALPAIALLLTSPWQGHPTQIVTSGDSHHRLVALTFDAGADRGFAAKILSILEQNAIHATFGMTGAWALANRDLVRRMAHDNDSFVNHTFDHRSFTGYSSRTAPLTDAQRGWEIMQTEKVLWSVAHRSARPFFRPPFGDYDPATLRLLRRMGYRYMIMWTVDSLGWEHLQAAAILNRCLAGLRPGTIYLMHVGIQSQDAFALRPLIQALRRRGYGFETIPQLVSGR